MKRIAFVVVALLFSLQPSVAATFKYTVENHSGSDISFFVRGAKIVGSTRVPSGSQSQVKVTLPEGKCRAEIHLDFESPSYLDDDKSINFCKVGRLVVR